MANAVGTGNLTWTVQDSGGTIIGTSNEFFLSQSIAATTTSFGIYSATVRSPRVIPSEVYLVVETTVGVATAAMYIDEVIMPSETRPKVIKAFEMLKNKRDTNPPRKHGNIPL